MIVWPHRCRIYRAAAKQNHDLSRVKRSSDIYSEDKPCRVLPSESEIFDMTPGGEAAFSVNPIDIHFPLGLAIKVGDVVEVKETRVRSGAREVIAAKLSVDASSGDTTIYVDDAVGFMGGQECTLSDGTNAQRVIIKSIDDLEFTLFDALEYDFDADTDLEVDAFYKIMAMKVPATIGTVIQAAAVETFSAEYDG
jgi:hypothetical protein